MINRTAVWFTVLAAVLAMVGGGGTGSATPSDPVVDSGALLASPVSADGSRISSVEVVDARSLTLQVYSAAMGRDITVGVQRPADASRPQPVLYLMNGGGGGVDLATWQRNTDVLPFLADKNVNVVQPVGGRWSYYTDWVADDPVLGRNKWQTFLTEELPPLIDAALGTSGVNAIAGLSMAATSVLSLAISAPGLYRSVASYSGCAQTSDPVGKEIVKTAVREWGGGDAVNMWGPDDSPLWAANDPYLHADRLRGIDLFISAGSGLPGPHETPDSRFLITPGPFALANQVVVGGVIEAGTAACTLNLKLRTDQLGIPATYDFEPNGTHSWGYWQDAFIRSWPVLARGLGV